MGLPAVALASWASIGSSSGSAPADEPARVRCATRLSLALTGRAPSDALLADPDPQAKVDELLADPAFIDQFARFANSEMNAEPGETPAADATYFLAKHLLENNRPWHELFDGKNVVLHFTPRPAYQLLVACLYADWSDPKEGRLQSFAAITDEPPPEIKAAGHDRCIINLRPENVEAWLTPEGRSDAELQAILSDRQQPYYEHEVMAA